PECPRWSIHPPLRASAGHFEEKIQGETFKFLPAVFSIFILFISISIRILALPSPGVFAHFFQSAFCYPVQFILRLCSVTVTGCNVSCTARFNLVRDFFSACLAECFYHVKYGISISCSQVVYGYARFFFQLFYSAYMSNSKVYNVDVIAHSCAVMSIVIISEYAEFL